MATADTIQLGKGNLRSSRLAYGCWRIAGTWDPTLVTPEKEDAGRKAVRAAYEAGYTLFDLADIYCAGACERIFGRVLKEIPGLRQRVAIATKCGIRFKGQPHPESPYRYDSRADHIIRSCEESLKRIGVETIDLYLIHRPDYLGDPQEVAQAFAKLQTDGKVREFGLSNFRPSQVALYQKVCPQPLVVNQVEINLEHLDPFHDGTLDQCMAESITPLAWSPLAGGRLGDSGPIDLHSPDHAQRIHVREVLDLIARERATNRNVIALAWLLRHPARIVPIVGSTNPDRIRELMKATELELTRDEWYRVMESAFGQRLP